MGKTKKAVSHFGKSIAGTLTYYPVETGILLYAFVMEGILIESARKGDGANLALVPLFFALSFILNNLLRIPSGSGSADASFRPPHLAYYLCWLPIVPLWFVDPMSWVASPQYVVALACAFLGVLLCRRASDNRRFVSEGLAYLINVAVPLVFASIAFLLILGIYYSITYIFKTGQFNFPLHAALFTYVVAAPLLFLTFTRSGTGRDFFPNKFFDTLLNYILSPALLIYTAVLYIYFVKIAAQWELPEGGIAYMVFAFTLIAIIAKGCQPLLSRDYYGWFYNRFSLISTPAVIMFWVAVMYRLGEYGFTEMRIYLILCGVIMTATLVMFALKGRGRYLTAALMTVVLLAVFTYIPPISAKQLAISSQKSTFMALAGSLGMIAPDGSFLEKEKLPPYDPANAEKYKRVYESMRYLASTHAEIQGMRIYEFQHLYSATEEVLPARVPETFTGVYNEAKDFDISGYSELHEVGQSEYYDRKFYADNENSMLVIYKSSGVGEKGGKVWSIPIDSLIDSQLAKIGYSRDNMPDGHEISKKHPEFLIYDAGSMRIVFSSMYIGNETKGISSVSVKYLLVK